MQRRDFLYAVLGLALLALSGCGPSEEQQAKALADFIDQHTLQRQGIHLALPSKEERETFGRFAQDYEILTNFQIDTNASSKELWTRLRGVPQMMSAGDPTKFRPEIATARESMIKMNQIVDDAVSHAQDARAALKQPEVLKTRFDQAFERVVFTQQKVMHDILPAMLDGFDAELAVVDFIIAHKANITGSGMNLQVDKPDVRAQLQKLLDAYNAKVPGIREAQRKIQTAGQ
jgi:hypothetical protein